MNRFAALLPLLLLQGCLHAEILRLGTALPPRPADSPVQVFASDPPEPHQELAMLEITTGLGVTNPKVVEEFQRAAREVGGDAIVLVHQQIVGMSVSTMQSGPMVQATSSAQVRHLAKAILFTRGGLLLQGSIMGQPAPPPTPPPPTPPPQPFQP